MIFQMTYENQQYFTGKTPYNTIIWIPFGLTFESQCPYMARLHIIHIVALLKNNYFSMVINTEFRANL